MSVPPNDAARFEALARDAGERLEGEDPKVILSWVADASTWTENSARNAMAAAASGHSV